MTADELIEIAAGYQGSGEPGFLSWDIPDCLYEKAEEFWRQFEVATNTKLPETAPRGNFFRCAC